MLAAGAASAPVVNWGIFRFPEAPGSYNFIYIHELPFLGIPPLPHVRAPAGVPPIGARGPGEPRPTDTTWLRSSNRGKSEKAPVSGRGQADVSLHRVDARRNPGPSPADILRHCSLPRASIFHTRSTVSPRMPYTRSCRLTAVQTWLGITWTLSPIVNSRSACARSMNPCSSFIL